MIRVRFDGYPGVQELSHELQLVHWQVVEQVPFWLLSELDECVVQVFVTMSVRERIFGLPPCPFTQFQDVQLLKQQSNEQDSVSVVGPSQGG